MKKMLIGALVCFACWAGEGAADALTAVSKIETNVSEDWMSLRFDFPHLRIGCAEYVDGPTGCTLFYFPKGCQAAVDIRGGSHGTQFTERLHNGYGYLDAIVFAGGSLMGLEAINGVSRSIFEQRKGDTSPSGMPMVSGAILNDYVMRPGNRVYPDLDLGMAAFTAARPNQFPIGKHGAGISASVGKIFGIQYAEAAGQGAAFRQVGAIKVAVFTVVNALGAIYDRQGRQIHGLVNPKTGKRFDLFECIEQIERQIEQVAPPASNTTLTVVVINQKLPAGQLVQLARQVHNAMGRVIFPFGVAGDGDTLYCVSTNEVEIEDQKDFTYLGIIASELAWEAVFSAFSRPTPKQPL